MLNSVQSPVLAQLPRVAHGFFGRQGGVSDGVYGSLNCGLGSNDDRAKVLENRRRVAHHIGTSADQLLTCHQIHSATAVFVDTPWAADCQPKADAIVTRTPGLALAALAADCTPVLFSDAEAGVIAAAHAGWRGALGGILEATLAQMEAAGARRRNIVAAVGPCIGPTAYEVGPEFEAAFLEVQPAYARYFGRPTPTTMARFDLPGFIAARLRAAGAGRIDVQSPCTYIHADRFFSYRRTTHTADADYGRQISAIMLT